VTKNGGESWIDITRNLPRRYFTYLFTSPHNTDEVFVTLSGFGSSHLYKSVSNHWADEWIDISQGLPDVPTNTVIVDPLDSRNVYIGNDLGVWASTDGGENWGLFKEGMSNAALVYDLSISESNRKIRAVTHGNGVYERSLLPVSTTHVDDRVVPVAVKLYRNYPNPFNPETTISFTLTQQTFVTITVHNTRGQEIAVLANQAFSTGTHRVVWNGRDKRGNEAASGIYFYTMKTDRQVLTNRMVLIR
jgi:hypothetical protein